MGRGEEGWKENKFLKVAISPWPGENGWLWIENLVYKMLCLQRFLEWKKFTNVFQFDLKSPYVNFVPRDLQSIQLSVFRSSKWDIRIIQNNGLEASKDVISVQFRIVIVGLLQGNWKVTDHKKLRIVDLGRNSKEVKLSFFFCYKISEVNVFKLNSVLVTLLGFLPTF